MKISSKPNIRKVAEKAGVSVATASRALNGNASVKPDLANKVFKAAEELNYLKSNNNLKYGNFVYIVPYLSTSYYSRIVEGAIKQASLLGRRLIVMSSFSDSDLETKCFELANQPSTAGIIFTPISNRDPRNISQGLKNIPLVITGPKSLLNDVPHVYQDNYNAGYLSTKYLLRLGHRRIAFFANFWTNHINNYESFISEYNSLANGSFSVYDRFKGYSKALEEYSVELDPNLIFFGGFDYESGYSCAKKLLASSINFEAILAPNDRCGAGVLKLLVEQGIDVPNDVSIICMNGGNVSKYVTPMLTTIATNNQDVGANAVLQLDKLCNGEKAQNVKIEVSLIIRESTKVVKKSRKSV